MEKPRSFMFMSVYISRRRNANSLFLSSPLRLSISTNDFNFVDYAIHAQVMPHNISSVLQPLETQVNDHAIPKPHHRNSYSKHFINSFLKFLSKLISPFCHSFGVSGTGLFVSDCMGGKDKKASTNSHLLHQLLPLVLRNRYL